jgi:catechol 2,3-dioxygenase-like lactoylglutathione lyase family enzyme
MLKIEGLNHATFPVGDVDKARDFYGRILVSCLINLRAVCAFMDGGGSDAALPACGARGVL